MSVGAKEGNEVDGTNVGTCVGLGVGLRVGSGFGVGDGVGYFVGFDVVGAGVGFRDGFGVGFVVNKYGFVRINCSMRSLPRRCCMRQRALRAASSAPHATTSSNRRITQLWAAQVCFTAQRCLLAAAARRRRREMPFATAVGDLSRCWSHRFVLHQAGCRWRPRFEWGWSVRVLSVWEVSGAMVHTAIRGL